MPTLHTKKYVENTWPLKEVMSISTDEVHYQFMQKHLVVLSIILIGLIQIPVTNCIVLPLKFLNFPIVRLLPQSVLPQSIGARSFVLQQPSSLYPVEYQVQHMSREGKAVA